MAKFQEIYNFNNLFHQNEFLVGNIKCYDIKFHRYKKIRDCDKDQMDIVLTLMCLIVCLRQFF